MAKQSHRRCDQLPVLHPDAAGIDVGASELFVAVAADRDPQPVRRLPAACRRGSPQRPGERSRLLPCTVFTIKDGHDPEAGRSMITVSRKLKCTPCKKSRLRAARISLNTFRTKQGAGPPVRRARATKTVLLF